MKTSIRRSHGIRSLRFDVRLNAKEVILYISTRQRLIFRLYSLLDDILTTNSRTSILSDRTVIRKSNPGIAIDTSFDAAITSHSIQHKLPVSQYITPVKSSHPMSLSSDQNDFLCQSISSSVHSKRQKSMLRIFKTNVNDESAMDTTLTFPEIDKSLEIITSFDDSEGRHVIETEDKKTCAIETQEIVLFHVSILLKNLALDSFSIRQYLSSQCVSYFVPIQAMFTKLARCRVQNKIKPDEKTSWLLVQLSEDNFNYLFKALNLQKVL